MGLMDSFISAMKISEGNDDDIFDDAEWKYKQLDKEMSLESVVYYLLEQGYKWGRSDGN